MTKNNAGTNSGDSVSYIKNRPLQPFETAGHGTGGRINLMLEAFHLGTGLGEAEFCPGVIGGDCYGG